MSIEGGNVLPLPGDGYQEHQGREVLEMVLVKLIFQRIEKRLDFFGETDDLEHKGYLLLISCSVKPLIDEIASFC